MNAPLIEEVAALEGQGMTLQCHPQLDNWIILIFEGYPLSSHFIPPHSDLLIKIPPLYPFAGLDMFWTEPDVRLVNGSMPANTNIEVILDRQWLRFSWHPASPWRQGVDNLTTYVAFINRRLASGG